MNIKKDVLSKKDLDEIFNNPTYETLEKIVSEYKMNKNITANNTTAVNVPEMNSLNSTVITEPIAAVQDSTANLSMTKGAEISPVENNISSATNPVPDFSIPPFVVPPIAQNEAQSISPNASPIEFGNIFEPQPQMEPTVSSMGMTDNFTNTIPNTNIPVTNSTPFFGNTNANNMNQNQIPITNQEPTTLFGSIQRSA